MTETEENELICERLLGWIRVKARRDPFGQAWRPRNSNRHSYELLRTPRFTTWEEVGLLIDEMTARHCREFESAFQRVTFEWDRSRYPTLRLSIRAAALAYAMTLTAICKSCVAHFDPSQGHYCRGLHAQ